MSSGPVKFLRMTDARNRSWDFLVQSYSASAYAPRSGYINLQERHNRKCIFFLSQKIVLRYSTRRTKKPTVLFSPILIAGSLKKTETTETSATTAFTFNFRNIHHGQKNIHVLCIHLASKKLSRAAPSSTINLSLAVSGWAATALSPSAILPPIKLSPMSQI